MEKVAVAMSGGVDSSVAAALLKERGYQVVGVTMRLWPEDAAGTSINSPSDSVSGARRVADALGIPHHVIDLSNIFHDKVIAPFCQEYRMGRTPNPCVRCNRYLKFDALFQQARSLGARYIATGHHARVSKDDTSGRMLLYKGRDREKDQSYFLYALTQEQLSRTMFPIGHLTKEEVRAMVRERNLPTGRQPESQDICFIKNNNYANFLRDLIPQASRPGPILDEQGNILGRHRGIMNYTIGQRRGLGIAAREPQYVVAIEPEHNTVIVGRRERALGDELVAAHVNWVAIDRPTGAFTAKAKIRYRHLEAEVTITPVDEDQVYVKFKVPQLAIAPGQAIVFYDGDKVLGGGTIMSSGKSMAPEPVMARVVAICTSQKKGTRKKAIAEGQLEEGYGLVGDAHAGCLPNRQVSLLALESIDKMRRLGLELHPGDFAENITVEGMNLCRLPIGTKLVIGEDVLLEVSQIGKECHTACAIRRQVGQCIMPEEGVFARVLRGGKVRPGDKVSIGEGP